MEILRRIYPSKPEYVHKRSAVPDEPTDEDLLDRYCEGDMHAFELLSARYQRPVFNYLLRSGAQPSPGRRAATRRVCKSYRTRRQLRRKLEVLDLALHHRAQSRHRPQAVEWRFVPMLRSTGKRPPVPSA